MKIFTIPSQMEPIIIKTASVHCYGPAFIYLFIFVPLKFFTKMGKNENGIKYFLTYSLLYIFAKKLPKFQKNIVTFPLVL
jgi:hypothetical protein